MKNLKYFYTILITTLFTFAFAAAAFASDAETNKDLTSSGSFVEALQIDTLSELAKSADNEPMLLCNECYYLCAYGGHDLGGTCSCCHPPIAMGNCPSGKQPALDTGSVTAIDS